jgi:hypothetical protein
VIGSYNLTGKVDSDTVCLVNGGGTFGQTCVEKFDFFLIQSQSGSIGTPSSPSGVFGLAP